MQQWDRSRAPKLAALAAAALPGEDLSADELLTSCWDDLGPNVGAGPLGAGAVLATDDGRGAAALVVRPAVSVDAAPVAYLQLIVVHPDVRRSGYGHKLLAAIEERAWDLGAGELRLEGAVPFYLWPGVDAMATEMLCLADSRGYRLTGSGLNMTLPANFRADPPDGVTLRRVLTDTDVALIQELLDASWPEWTAETCRAIEHGCCHGAFAVDPDAPAGCPGERAVGFACHSVSRAGWLGPMGTDPTWRSAGVGRALMAQVSRDLMIAEYDTTEICWAGPVRFYAKCGATVSRVFLRYRLARP